jgi:chondroitin-sulfate-ABC endolyase/exolyase
MKKIILLLITGLATSTVSQAQINLNGNWSPVGTTTLTKVTNDPDGGDGISDGALLINGTTAVPGQGVIYTFGGTIEAGKTYSIDTYVYNFGNSHVKVIVSLFNSTTNTVLSSSDVLLLQTGTGKTPELSVPLSYTATAADAGNILQLRYIRSDDGNTSRDFNIDSAKLNGVVISSPLLATKNKR